MTIYCDTSLIVAALTPEVATSRVRGWLNDQKADTLCLSGWVLTEVFSAVSLKVRSGALSIEDRASVLTDWVDMHRLHFREVAIPATAFERAGQFAGQPELALRSGDALHIAIAALNGLRMASLDPAMVSAAVRLGITADLV